MAVRTFAGGSAAYSGAQVVLPGSITHVTKSRGESGVSAWPMTATGTSPASQRCGVVPVRRPMITRGRTLSCHADGNGRQRHDR
jgi:hypothetical protein